MMQVGSLQASDLMDPTASNTLSEKDIESQLENNGFGKVQDAGHLVANAAIVDSRGDLDEIEDQIIMGSSLGNKRSGDLPALETDTKAPGTGQLADPYQHAIDTKMTQMKMEQSPMLDANSDASGVELNKLSQLLAKW